MLTVQAFYPWLGHLCNLYFSTSFLRSEEVEQDLIINPWLVWIDDQAGLKLCLPLLSKSVGIKFPAFFHTVIIIRSFQLLGSKNSFSLLPYQVHWQFISSTSKTRCPAEMAQQLEALAAPQVQFPAPTCSF